MSDVKTEPTPDQAAAAKQDQEKRAAKSKEKSSRDVRVPDSKNK